MHRLSPGANFTVDGGMTHKMIYEEQVISRSFLRDREELCSAGEVEGRSNLSVRGIDDFPPTLR
jgi:hypothetical protein